MREENSFENKEIAEQWIQSIETVQHRSREREVYPLLYSWSHDLQPSVIVEIGSGQGVCSSKVDISNGKYIGIEPSTTLIERARELYPEANKEFLSGNSYEIPLPDFCTDAVFSVCVWFHVADLDKAHKEVGRILKQNGKLLIVTSNPEEKSMWESFFENPSVKGKKIEGKIFVPGGMMSHNVLYVHTKEEIIESLKANGFSVDSFEEMGFGDGTREQGLFSAIHATKL